MITPTVGLAFLAGLASFLSPCVFSLVPAYIGYLGGRSAALREDFATKGHTVVHGVTFVLGFSLVFVTLGVTASALGGLLVGFRDLIAKVGGIIVIVFGLHLIGILRIPFLEYDLRYHSQHSERRGLLTSFLMGVFFSAGWSPCVGPVLGAILMIALNGGSVTQGIVLLSAYSAGLAIPFLIAAVGIGWVTTILRKYGKVMRFTEIAMGGILVVVGALLALGYLAQLSR
ncbi:MAG: cytochrome c biogenesis protein CcdA, partial [Anaerolineales bacterium]|nr:cytochrome c biogenesis protein CcdA [Anaerolineales bacterium]MDW8446744.1 cytochrome c biogenesis protein CcdA [Anaerolineales bacterium]